ncbi:Cytochrome P450 [Corchorus olitorius]|uniref:Cytochrome P450 n=1 Tax=Corchorus olitorius TaxID=93759 RepID=A0A1R3K1X2_9ROSI|nr:Cytochrome P450 [Corchorus olitorius]
MFRKSFNDFMPIFRYLHAKFGPIITLRFGSKSAIFISDRFIAHQALVKEGALFSDRAPSFDGTNQRQISTAFYGEKWKSLRRNLTIEILQLSRMKSYSLPRKWAIELLLRNLKLQSINSGHQPVRVLEHFKLSMFSALVFMCFGKKLEDNTIMEISDIIHRLMSSFGKVSMIYMISFWPKILTKFLFGRFLEEVFRAGQRQREMFLPIIEERRKLKEERSRNGDKDHQVIESDIVPAYVDTLLDIKLPEENRSLNDDELVNLSSEFLIGGTHFITSTLQWIMASLVKNPHIQEKLFNEIKGVVGKGEEMVKEDDLPRMPYLKAVILEGLRRYPVASFLLPRKVTEDVVLNGYKIPKNGIVNFLTGDIGKDPEVWEDPLAFKPERFLMSDENENGGIMFDIKGNRELKMVPFGAGRRSCPGYALALVLLELYVANLVWSFEWQPVDGQEVDMEEIQEYALTMKNPLKAKLVPRF